MLKVLRLDKYGKTKRWFILSAGILVLSASITFGLIKLFKPSTSVTNDSSVVTTLTSVELVKQYADKYKLGNYTTSRTVTDSVLDYQPGGSTYSVQIKASDSVQFDRANNSNTSDLSRAFSDGSDYLIGHGATKVSSQVIANANQSIYTTQNTICKLYTNFDSVNKSSKYGLICAAKMLFSDEQSQIQSLINIYKKTESLTATKSITRTTHTQDNKSVSLLSVTPEDSTAAPYMLVFAAIDNSWSYIGRRTAPSVDIRDSFQIPAQLQSAINNSSARDLLIKYVK